MLGFETKNVTRKLTLLVHTLSPAVNFLFDRRIFNANSESPTKRRVKICIQDTLAYNVKMLP